jgi:hypothetical protein
MIFKCENRKGIDNTIYIQYFTSNIDLIKEVSLDKDMCKIFI